jgi:hypothetical protein
MFDVKLGRRKMVWGAIFWVVLGVIFQVVFHL